MRRLRRASVIAALSLLASAATASASGGWSLMYPPADPPLKDKRSPVPLREWIIWGSFSSASECEIGRIAEMRVAEVVFSRASEKQTTVKSGVYNDPILLATKRSLQFAEVRQKQMWASLCIPSNASRLLDPRGASGK